MRQQRYLKCSTDIKKKVIQNLSLQWWWWWCRVWKDRLTMMELVPREREQQEWIKHFIIFFLLKNQTIKRSNHSVRWTINLFFFLLQNQKRFEKQKKKKKKKKKQTILTFGEWYGRISRMIYCKDIKKNLSGHFFSGFFFSLLILEPSQLEFNW